MLNFIKALEPTCKKYCTDNLYHWLGEKYWPEVFIKAVEPLTRFEQIAEYVSSIDPRLAAGVTAVAVMAGGVTYYIRNHNGTAVVEEAKKPATTATIDQVAVVLDAQAELERQKAAREEEARLAEPRLQREAQEKAQAEELRLAELRKYQEELRLARQQKAAQEREAQEKREALARAAEEEAKLNHIADDIVSAPPVPAERKAKTAEELAAESVRLAYEQEQAEKELQAKRARERDARKAKDVKDAATFDGRMAAARATIQTETQRTLQQQAVNVETLAAPAAATPGQAIPVQAIVTAFLKDRGTVLQRQRNLNPQAQPILRQEILTTLHLDRFAGKKPTDAEGIAAYNQVMDELKIPQYKM